MSGDFLGTILAAGLGKRFGAFKQTASLGGRPLVLWCFKALLAAGLDRIAVVTGPTVELPRELTRHPAVQVLINPHPEQGQGTSLALAADLARKTGARGMVVLLADQPFVLAETIKQTLHAAQSPPFAAAADNKGRPHPPTAFGAAHFAALASLTGDTGGRDILAGLGHDLPLVAAPEYSLFDVDRKEDLARAQDLATELKLYSPQAR